MDNGNELGKIKIPKLSYENSKRLLGLSCHIQSAIEDLIRNGYDKSREKVTSDVNKAIYDLAEKRKCSIYDICFHFMPVESEVRTERDPNDPLGQRYTISSEIQLVPIEFEFEQGPGYWNGKYFRLKQKLQELIDNKED
jgi:hypothetical protein